MYSRGGGGRALFAPVAFFGGRPLLPPLMHSITALHNEEGEREDKESIRYPVRLAKLQRKAGGGGGKMGGKKSCCNMDSILGVRTKHLCVQTDLKSKVGSRKVPLGRHRFMGENFFECFLRHTLSALTPISAKESCMKRAAAMLFGKPPSW